MKTTKTTIETTAGLTSDEIAAVNSVASTRFETLDQAEANLKSWFPNWLVYRGGQHVALIRKSGDRDRVLFIENGNPARIAN